MLTPPKSKNKYIDKQQNKKIWVGKAFHFELFNSEKEKIVQVMLFFKNSNSIFWNNIAICNTWFYSY